MKSESNLQFIPTSPVNIVDKASPSSINEPETLVSVGEQEIVSEVANRRADMLKLWKEDGLSAVIQNFGEVSEGTLYRWQNMVRNANGSISVLNPADMEPKLDMEKDFPEIVEKFLPESSYLSVVQEPNSDRLHKVVDINEISNVLKEQILYRGVRVSRRKILDFLVEKYKNEKVLTREQVDTKEFLPKKLFYIPLSVSHATNSIEISDDDSHIGLWDVTNGRLFGDNGTDTYPTQDGSHVSFFEVKFAYILFHPKYGDARRNAADGELLVRNPNYDPEDNTSKKRVPITRELLRSYGIDVRHGTNEARHTISGMLQALPNLVQQKELRDEDFSRQHTRDSKGNFNEFFKPKEVESNGSVTLNGVRQYVGRRFEGCVVHPFTKDKALVFKEEAGRRVLVAAFTIVGKENASAIDERGDGRAVPRANKDKTEVLDIKYQKKVTGGTNSLESNLEPQRQIELENKVTEAVTLLIETANQAEKIVKSELGDLDDVTVAEIISSLRNDLLAQAEKAIEVAVRSNDAEALKSSMESFAFDGRTYVSVLQSIGVEKMINDPFDVVKASELSEQQREQMRKLLLDNYELAYSGEQNSEFRKTVAVSLDNAFKKSDTTFYLLNDRDKIVSFNRFDQSVDLETGRKVLYFGSFNAHPKYRGVGGIMLEHTIQEKLQECEAMQAHCDPASDISKKYIEDGFVATQTETVAGKFSFEIWRSKDSSDQLQTKKMSQEELVVIAGSTMDKDSDYFVREVEENDPFHELDEGLGYLMTRYFVYEGKTYAAFEINTSLSKQFVPPVVK